MAVEDWPLLRWRMREYTHGRWGTEIVRKNARLADDIVAAVAELGPSHRRADRGAPGSRSRAAAKGPWWDRSDTKWVAEALFASGVLTTAHRVGFARHYDLAERVLPPEVLAREVDDDEARARADAAGRHRAGRGHRGRHPRLLPAGCRAGQTRDRRAGGGRRAGARRGRRRRLAYLRAGQKIPRTDRGTALLCPFDPLIFFRPRVERLFGLPLPHRDLHAGAQAAVRLLRVAVPARRRTGRPRRPQGRPRRRRAARRRCVRRGRPRPVRGWRPRWRPNCRRWRAGSGWAGSASASGAIWSGELSRALG